MTSDCEEQARVVLQQFLAIRLLLASCYSVNDNLRRDLTHVAYSSVEDAALAIHTLGQGTQLAKIDIQSAYRIVPIHPIRTGLLGCAMGGSGLH